MPSQESDYLAELMADFRVDGSTIDTVGKAEAKIQLRYQSLLDSLVDSEAILNLLRSTSEESFPSLFGELAKFAHGMLYKDILSNAGSYRLPTDPKGGMVYFGTQSKGQPEFPGTLASAIESELASVFRHLAKNRAAPVTSAVTFYQQFVRVHPFYDANGRICRLLVSVYLDYHKRYVDWENLQRQGEWIGKLNACHRRQGQGELYNRYLGYLTQYFAAHVRNKSDLTPDA